jgi:hypothetical protein
MGLNTFRMLCIVVFSPSSVCVFSPSRVCVCVFSPSSVCVCLFSPSCVCFHPLVCVYFHPLVCVCFHLRHKVPSSRTLATRKLSYTYSLPSCVFVRPVGVGEDKGPDRDEHSSQTSTVITSAQVRDSFLLLHLI